MFRCLRCLLAFVLFASGVSFSQGAQPQREEPHLSIRSNPNFLIRILEVHMILSGSATRTCLIVYPNNSFHFEIWQQDRYDQKPKARYLVESTLTTSQSDQLNTIIQDSAIAKLDESGVPQRMVMAKEMRLLTAEISRKNFVIQSLATFGTEGKDVDPATRPIMSFLHSIDTKNLPPIKGATADICKTPQPAKAPSPQ